MSSSRYLIVTGTTLSLLLLP